MPGCYLLVLAMLCASSQAGELTDAQEIVRQATSRMQSDWAAAPGYAFVQRDMTTSKGVTTSKTHQVFMIEGSDYYMPVAINDQPLTPEQHEQELARLRQEVERRAHQSPEDAADRSEQYRKLREQNGLLLNEFTKAFEFTLAGEDIVNGHSAYMLDARPRPGYHPPNRTAKVLAGMQGRLWVDKETFHWIQAEAEAIKSVSVFGIFAKVLPGSRMELEMTPVTDSVWLVSRFALDMRISVFWHKSTKVTVTTFSDYQPAATALANALAAQ